MSRPYAPACTREWGLAVAAPRLEAPPPEGEGARAGAATTPPPPVRLEVGIEDCLHIELEYDRPAYGLTDTILGRVHFLLVRRRRAERRAERRAVCFFCRFPPSSPSPTQVRIKLKHMDLEIRRRESAGAGPGAR